jgi:hypothetical protein
MVYVGPDGVALPDGGTDEVALDDAAELPVVAEVGVPPLPAPLPHATAAAPAATMTTRRRFT